MIERHGNTAGIPGLPAISQVVTHNGLVYLCGVTPDPSGDITTQTRQVLLVHHRARVDTEANEQRGVLAEGGYPLVRPSARRSPASA